MRGVESVLRPCSVVLIVPPFHWTSRPHLGVHLLQAIAREMGIEAQVLYTNILFAAQVGEGSYESLSTMQYGMCQGERIFVRAAYGLPALGRDAGTHLAIQLAKLKEMYNAQGIPFDIGVDHFLHIEELVQPWVDSIARALAGGPQIVGCSSSFEQTASSIAMLSAIKQLAPQTLTVIGGANCEGPMARGMIGMSPDIDFVFSGESEETWRAFLGGERPESRIFDGRPCEDLDALPIPDYTDYYEQLEAWLPHTTMEPKLTFETSRGCWWGEKKHCTFCGLNGQGMASREKSADRAISELKTLLQTHPNRKINVTDNIMPYGYWKTYVPRLPDEVPGLEMMYEQKANLTLAQVRALQRAGITEIQPGIEALSTGLLKLMDKGTTCAQNIALLRYATSCNMQVHWNLLYGFPNDELAFYTETLELLPMLFHLCPPKRPGLVVIDRFSPYHTYPEKYGIRDIKPISGYLDVLPLHADVDTITYHFQATFESAAHANPAVIDRIGDVITAWRSAYFSANRPQLSIVPRGGDAFELIDTRGLRGTQERRALTRSQAITLLAQKKVTPATQRELAWALEAGLFVVRDGRNVPLAIATPELMTELTSAAPTIELLQAV
ncbi:MAG: RiPP maturation radical SAM C-methyltransferase [Kofleriaceae bacterium]